MKNKEFFYLQYDKINWKNQEKTKINSFINEYIIKNVIAENKNKEVRVFDIGFGIGFFLQMLKESLNKSFKKMFLSGCEPSEKNFNSVNLKKLQSNKVDLDLINKSFLEVETENKFDFLTAIYSLTHFTFDEMENVIKKVYSMLDDSGKFVLVVASEKYLEEKLKNKKDLFIEKNEIEIYEKKYNEALHYAEIPEIGSVLDFNREDAFYEDLFKRNYFDLDYKKDLTDGGFVCTIFVFSKK